jgi:hypothetical protein
MSRLDSMLRRLTAQRDGLTWAAGEIADQPGDVLDIGLGNGRTYDHLRELLPDRRIWVIDRILQCHHTCIPPEEDFLQGEAEPMLRKLAESGAQIRLAHYDLGRGVAEDDAAEAIAMSPLIARVMTPGGIVVSAQTLAGMTRLDGPDTVARDRYRFYRA